MSSNDSEKIVIGRIGKSFGVKGWSHVHAFSEPESGILQHKSWFIRQSNTWQQLTVDDIRPHQPGYIVKIHSINSPEEAKLLTNLKIFINKNDLPALEDDEYYRHELVGMTVINQNNDTLGIVKEIMETGANDVLVIEGKHRELIPYIDHVVTRIDQKQQIIHVDWEGLNQ